VANAALCVQHAAYIHIGGEGRFALHEFDRVHFLFGLADGLPGLRFRRDDNFWVWSARRCEELVAWDIEEHQGFRLRSEIPIDGGDPSIRFVAAHDRRGFQHGLHRFEIARAAAQHARDRLTNFIFTRVRIFLKQTLRREDLRRRAISALDRARFNESLLQRMQTIGLSPALFWDARPTLRSSPRHDPPPAPQASTPR
jgi:hypothetical protein